MRTVNIDATWVSVIEAPDPEVPDMEIEVTTSHEMQGLVFLNWHKWHLEKVWSTDNISLELNIVGLLAFDLIVNITAGHSNLFLSLRVNHVPRTNVGVI